MQDVIGWNITVPVEGWCGTQTPALADEDDGSKVAYPPPMKKSIIGGRYRYLEVLEFLHVFAVQDIDDLFDEDIRESCVWYDS